MPHTITRFHTDAWIAHDAPRASHGKGSRLWVRSDDSDKARRSLLMCAKPFPHNDALSVVEATLKLYLRNTDDWSGSTTVTAKGIAGDWRENRVNWDNQPDISTDSSSADVTDGEGGDLLEIDVTDQLQASAGGADWLGLELRSDRDRTQSFWSSDSSREQYHPRLDVHWALGPYAPTKCWPRGGGIIGTATPVMSFKFHDHHQDSLQAKSRLQISTDDDNFLDNMVFDTDWEVNTLHHRSLATAPSYTVDDGDVLFWRVAVEDDNGFQSGWSDICKFERQSHGTLTITDPGSDGIVGTLTPTFVWNYSHTQERAKLEVVELRPNGQEVQVFERKDRKDNDNDLTIWTRSKNPIIKRGKQYKGKLWVWDQYDRVSTPRDKPWVYASAKFHYERDGRPDPVESISLEQRGQSPGLIVTVTRSNAPDWFCLSVDDQEQWMWIDPDDYETDNPNEWSFVYWGLTPRQTVTIEVDAVDTIDGKRVHSKDNPTADFKIDSIGIWLIDEDETEAAVMYGNEDADLIISELATTYKRVANRVPARIRDSTQGFSGTFGGVVLGDSGKDNFLAMKGRDGELRVTAANLTFPVVLGDLSVSPTPSLKGNKYNSSMTIDQVGEFFDIE